MVRIHGLEKASLNGVLAVLQAPYSADRWVVQPLGGSSGAPVALRVQQLRMARRMSETAMGGLVVATILSVLLVAVALQSGPFSKVRALVPMASLMWYLTTLAVCYWLHAPLLADGVIVPAISEMGISSSGRLMYRVGFGLCGFMLAITMVAVHSLFSRFHPATPGLESGFYSGLLASAGIALQGLCTLRLTFSAETGAHFLGAVLTMMGAFSHASAWNDWFDALPKTSPLFRRGYQSWGLRLRREMLQQAGGPGVSVMFAIPLLLQAGKRLGFFSEINILENCMGFMQWTLVACIGIFFCSYAFDLC